MQVSAEIFTSQTLPRRIILKVLFLRVRALSHAGVPVQIIVQIAGGTGGGEISAELTGYVTVSTLIRTSAIMVLLISGAGAILVAGLVQPVGLIRASQGAARTLVLFIGALDALRGAVSAVQSTIGLESVYGAGKHTSMLVPLMSGRAFQTVVVGVITVDAVSDALYTRRVGVNFHVARGAVVHTLAIQQIRTEVALVLALGTVVRSVKAHLALLVALDTHYRVCSLAIPLQTSSVTGVPAQLRILSCVAL